MTAIGLCLLVVAFLGFMLLELAGSKNGWYGIALSYVAAAGVVLTAVGFVIWIWRVMP